MQEIITQAILTIAEELITLNKNLERLTSQPSQVSPEDVRAALTRLPIARATALLKEFGVERVTDLKKDNLPDVWARIQSAINRKEQ